MFFIIKEPFEIGNIKYEGVSSKYEIWKQEVGNMGIGNNVYEIVNRKYEIGSRTQKICNRKYEIVNRKY